MRSPLKLACSLQVIVIVFGSKWHTFYRPPGRGPICEPYPGCKRPDALKELCPYTYVGELCTALHVARAAGMPHDALIVEVGSAFGFGGFIARHFGHPFLGFECREDEFERLRKQFQDDRHVKIVQSCVAEKPGIAKLFRAKDSSSMIEEKVARVPQAKAKAENESSKEEAVRMVTLDEMLGGLNVLNELPPVGILAIDVQGAEPLVLRGAKEMIMLHRPFVMYEDTELKVGDKGGKLFAKVLREMGPTAPRYQDCYCERDCYCIPDGNYSFVVRHGHLALDHGRRGHLNRTEPDPSSTSYTRTRTVDAHG